MVILLVIDKNFIMNTDNIVISLDDAYMWYESTKRIVSWKPLYCYDLRDHVFARYDKKHIKYSIPFINAYATCSKLMDEYLNHSSQRLNKIKFEKHHSRYKNKIVNFLWFYEDIDGSYGFQNYEIRRITDILKSWCISNGFDYIESEICRDSLECTK